MMQGNSGKNLWTPCILCTEKRKICINWQKYKLRSCITLKMKLHVGIKYIKRPKNASISCYNLCTGCPMTNYFVINIPLK